MVSDFGSLEILLMLLWKLAEFLLFANCLRAYKTFSASIVAGVFSLRDCGWLGERFVFCFPEDVLGEQYVTSSWFPVMSRRLPICSVAPVTISWPSSGPEFCVIWMWQRPASGWGSFWESSSFVPWLVLNALREGSGVVPEWPWSSGFKRKSSRRASMRFSVLLNSLTFFLWPFPQFPRKLGLCSLPPIWEHSSFVPSCS